MISMRLKSTERLQVAVVILIGQKAEAFLASSHDSGLFLYHTTALIYAFVPSQNTKTTLPGNQTNPAKLQQGENLGKSTEFPPPPRDQVSLCSPRTCSVDQDQAGLELCHYTQISPNFSKLSSRNVQKHPTGDGPGGTSLVQLKAGKLPVEPKGQSRWHLHVQAHQPGQKPGVTAFGAFEVCHPIPQIVPGVSCSGHLETSICFREQKSSPIVGPGD